jgi:hypothetical protein
MADVITYRGEMSEAWYRHYLMVVCRWLLKQSVALDHVPRTRSNGRWLYVFDRLEDAEELATQIRGETEDDAWAVAPLEGPPDVGPLRPITVEMGWGGESVGFGLNWQITLALRMHYPKAVPHDEVWIKTEQKWAFTPEGIRELVLEFLPFLTGLTIEQLSRFGGFEVIEPGKDKVVVPFTPFVQTNGAGGPASSATHHETATSPAG